MYQFTSESVSEGHPDKVADAISDAIATHIINKNLTHRAAIETLVTTNMVTLAGEFKSDVDMGDKKLKEIVQHVIKTIGYDQEGFSWRDFKFYNELHGQSPDIALGTDNFGAGDQGLMFGYACKETDNLMPAPIYYSHEILKELTRARKVGENWLGPDSKSQVTFNYGNDGKPIDIAKIVCSTQHSEDLNIEEVRKRVIDIILPVVKDLKTDATEWLINPTGRFVIGGPDGDTGLTGRKIIVDTYGGSAPHGGGAFSGKDPTKVDRSATYAARWLAKNLAHNGWYQTVLVQLSYAIGVEQPTSLTIWTNGVINHSLSAEIRDTIDFTPKGIIDFFNLFNLDLTLTTNYGHFGKMNLPWEKIVDTPNWRPHNQ